MIDAHRERFGVEPICRVLEMPTSSYYAAKQRRPRPGRGATSSSRSRSSGSRTTTGSTAPARSGGSCTGRARVARCTVERLMRDLGLGGMVRGKTRGPQPTRSHGRRTWSAGSPRGPQPAVGRGPDLCADLVGVRLRRAGDRRVLPDDRGLAGGHPPAHRPGPGRAGDGHLAPTDPAAGLVHHWDRGVQYLSIRYTERLAEAGAVTSVGSRGDSYDNALAEATRALQDRTRPPPRPLAQHRRPGAGHLGVGRLVQPPPPAQRMRPPPATEYEATHPACLP